MSRQIDDQCLSANDRYLPGQDRGGHEVQADLAHLLAKPWHFLVGHRQRGFGRDIAFGWARASRGQHQVAAALINQLDQCALNDRLFIGDETGL